jgi:outer membrane lipoprotein-sorting protein
MPQIWPVLADNKSIPYEDGRRAADSGKIRMNSFSQLTRRAVIGLGLLALAAFPARAAKPIDVTPEQAASINALTDYLNSFKTIQGEFTQISPKGNLSRGVFFIQKPGKMRFEYAPPNPFLIVADGRWLTIKNVKKEKGDQFPLSQTPLRLVLGNKVNILKDTHIIGFEEQDGIASITVEDKETTLGNGQLMLVFDKTRNVLQQWVVIDGKGRRTTVTLENVEAGIKPDPKLFFVKIDRDKNLR